MYIPSKVNNPPKEDVFFFDCPVCRTQISSTATNCYLCGSPVNKEWIERMRIEKSPNSKNPDLTMPPPPTPLPPPPSAQSFSLPIVQPFNVQPTMPSEPRIEQKEVETLRAALEREQRDKNILKSELEIKSAEIKMFEGQDHRLKKLEQIKDMLDSTKLEKNRLVEEIEYLKRRNIEMEKYVLSMEFLENDLDRKEGFIEELLKEKSSLQTELEKYQTVGEELEEKKKNIEYLKNEMSDLKESLKKVDSSIRRDEHLKGIRQLLEKETRRKEKLEREVKQLENVRNLLKKEKKDREKLQSELDEKDRELGEMENINELLDAEKKECLRLRNELAAKAKIEDLLKIEELKRKEFEDTVKLRDEKTKGLADEIEKLNEKLANLKKLETVVKEERDEKEKLKAEYDGQLKYIQNLEKRLIELEKTIPMVKCPACNSPIGGDAKTCPSCGAVFSESLISIEAKHGDVKINVEELQRKQQEIEEKEKEIRELQKELREKEKLYNGKWETLKYKEEELTRRENEITIKTTTMKEQKSFLNTLKDEMKDPTALVNLNEELQNLKGELKLKEETLRDREIHLRSRLKEVEIKEAEMANIRFDAYDLPDATRAVSSSTKMDKLVVKIRSGVPRLDDLLYGGFPAGSSILLSGPSFIGKETLCNMFVAEGINRDVPCLYITVDENYSKIMSRLSEMVPNCEACEKKDSIRYIDMYSVRTNPSLVSIRHPENVDFLENLRDLEALSMTINKSLDAISKKGKYYRLVFPISTFLMNMDAMTLIKFLEPINARVKMDSSVAIYNINPGLHAERDVEMVRHIMDGTIEFKLTDVRKSFSIQGISNVQTRSWIDYNNTETSLIIGSFTVEKIK